MPIALPDQIIHTITLTEYDKFHGWEEPTIVKIAEARSREETIRASAIEKHVFYQHENGVFYTDDQGFMYSLEEAEVFACLREVSGGILSEEAFEKMEIFEEEWGNVPVDLRSHIISAVVSVNKHWSVKYADS